MTIEEYFGDWSRVLDLEEIKRITKRLSDSHQIICPQRKDIFKAFRFCPLKDLRVVLLGQDPYSNLKNKVPVATGIAFANSADTPCSCYSPSLTVLRESFIDFTVPHKTVTFEPTLEKMEEQGVLLLNSALTCEVNRPQSHSLMWRPFITSLLTNLSRHYTGIVYVLMGGDAQSFEPCINKAFNHVIRIRHPSYYARTKTRMPSDVWQKVNDILVSQNGYGIKWYQEY